MKHLTFIKESTDKWYIDLPNWKGDRSELQMILGADTLLDILAKKKNSVKISTSLISFPDCSILELLRVDTVEGGGHYLIRNYNNEVINLELWICDVIKFIFDLIPEKIFFRVLN